MSSEEKPKKKKKTVNDQSLRDLPEMHNETEDIIAMQQTDEDFEDFQERYGSDYETQYWYPYRHYCDETELIKLRTQGEYQSKYPKGITIHWTAGRSRPEELAGGKYGKTAEKHAIQSIKYAKKHNIACYFVMDRLGRIYQNFPLNEWGWHAGKSYYHGIGGMLSKHLVGIEIQCAGKLKEASQEDLDAFERYWKFKLDSNAKYYKAWFTRPERGDYFFTEDEVRFGPDKDNCFEGFYHKFTEAQEKSLTQLILWLEKNGKGKFSLNNVLGHDSIAKPNGRKVDPGWSLSMTIPEYQKYLMNLNR